MTATRPRRRLIRLALPLMLIAGLGAVALLARDRIEERVVPPAAEAPATPPVAELTAEERAFYDEVAPRLAKMSAETAVLAKLGQERSRNLVELQVRSDRVAALAGEIDAYVTNVPPPPRFAGAMDRYHAGVAEVTGGMADAKAAFFKFDWTALGTALDRFTAGAAHIEEAYRLMASEAGMATAAASPAAG